MKKRKAFNLYSSYDDVMQELDDKQFIAFVRALHDVQFLRKHIEVISFEDKLLSICWKAIKHSVNKQIEGYCNANKIAYDSLFDDVSCANEAPINPANEAPINPANEAQIKPASVQEKEQVQEKEEYTLLENEFQAIWKDYTLTFLKKQNRGGGSKKNALAKYKALIKKGHTVEEIKNAVRIQKGLSVGHKDLERVLTVDNLKQIKEDGDPTRQAQHYDTSGNPIKGNFQW